MDDPHALTLRDFAERPRAALMWPPRARDVARIAAAARAVAGGAPARVLDAGAGSGLIARLLADAGLDVVAVDAEDADSPTRGVGRFFPVKRARVQDLPREEFDLAIVSWMEAGRDYRAAVHERARVIVEAYDPMGGCGAGSVTGFLDLERIVATLWPTASHEDVAHALRTRGRGPAGLPLTRAAAPGNLIMAWARDDTDANAVNLAVARAEAGAPLPWEPQLDELQLP